MRNTGINIVGEAPWGTHFCLFYHNHRELLDVVLSYLKAGLEANECCVWILGPDLAVREAKTQLGRIIPRINRYFKSGQLEILSHADWYLRDGAFQIDSVLDKSLRKIEFARERGFDGVRVTGDSAWIEDTDWNTFCEYERRVNATAAAHPTLSMCTYCLDRLGPLETLEVMRNHQFALVRKGRKWDIIESSSLAKARRELNKSERKLELLASFPELDPNPVLEIDTRTGVVTYANEASQTLFPGLAELGSGHACLAGIGEIARKLARGRAKLFERELWIGQACYRQSISLGTGKNKVRVYGNDISEIKRAQEEVALTLESIGDGFFAIDGEWRFIYVNALAERLVGMNGADVIGKNYWEIYPLVRGTQLEDEFRRAMAGQITDFEFYYPPMDAWFHNRCYPRKGGGLSVFFQNITEQNRARETVRESEARVRLAVSAADMGTWDYNLATKTLAWDARTHDLFGVPQDMDVNYELFLTRVHPEDREHADTIIKRALDPATGGLFDVEYRTVDFTAGVARWIRTTGKAFFNEAGLALRLMGTVQDITERKVAAQEVEENRAKLHAALTSMTDAMFIADAKGRFVHINDAFAAFHRFKTKEECAKSHQEFRDILEFIGPDGVPLTFDKWLLPRALAGEIATNDVYTVRRKDTGDTWIGSYSYGPVRDLEGSIIGAVITARDITSQKRAEQELADLQRRQAMILDNIADGFFAIDSDWRLIHINAATLAFYGKSREEAIGHSLFEVFPELIGSPLEGYFKKAMKSGEPVHFVEPSRIKTDRILEINAYPGADNLTVLFRDITERKNREQELHRLNRALRALSNSDRAMMHATNEPDYLADVCRIVVEDCGHLLVWIGYAEHDEHKTVRPVAYAGLDTSYIQNLDVTWSDQLPTGRGPTGEAIRTGKSTLCRNMLTDPNFEPWRDEASKRGYFSSLALPLITGDTTLGALVIYSQQVDPFTNEEISLMSALADDLAHGIFTLRMRDANRRAGAEIKANLARFELLADSASQLLQASNPQEVIPALCRRVMEQLDCQVYFAFLLDEESGRLHMKAYAGISDEYAREHEWLDNGTSIASAVAAEQHEIIVEHVPQSPDPRTGFIKFMEIKAYACHPMFGPGGAVIGTLSFGTRTRETLSEADVSLMKAITDQVAVAMVRMQVEHDLRHSQAELVDLNQTLEKRIAERTSQLDRLNADLERHADQLRALAQELTEAEEHERRRLADILHDDLQQLLVGAKLHLSLIPSRITEPAAVSDLVAKVTTMIDETIGKSRGLAHDLSPPLLRQQGLIATLDWLCRQMKNKYGLDVSLRAEFRSEISDTLKVFLFRAAQEMLFNVVKHAAVNDARVIIEQTDGHVRMIVSDRGKGFTVREGVPSNWGTSGFGLFSIHERANLLGGRLIIESAPGQGSRFTLEIPIEPGAEPLPVDFRPVPAAVRVAESPPPPPMPEGRAPLRVMLVDDHPVMRQGLAAILLNEPDLTVVGEAEDGRQAIDIVQSAQPDVIIMDVSMPIMDGIEATRQIKREWPAIRIIGLSMFEEEDLARAMIEAGAESYVSKSLGLKELVDTIRTAKVK